MSCLFGKIGLSDVEGVIEYLQCILVVLLTQQGNAQLQKAIGHLGMVGAVHVLPDADGLLQGVDGIVQIVGTDIDNAHVVQGRTHSPMRIAEGGYELFQYALELLQGSWKVTGLEILARLAVPIAQPLLVHLAPALLVLLPGATTRPTGGHVARRCNVLLALVGEAAIVVSLLFVHIFAVVFAIVFVVDVLLFDSSIVGDFAGCGAGIVGVLSGSISILDEDGRPHARLGINTQLSGVGMLR
mmetsp:Transcript_13902/g.39962  ORF Transcript_13902/g.39962 Transcript_13902/m.39962 type:complete len:242 (-) Transcript_13902:870-1595(-)